MKFDYRVGKEASFRDWVMEGCKKAEEMLCSTNTVETENKEPNKNN